MADKPQVGDRAPDFTLPRSGTDSYVLSEVVKNGKAVVAFYVGDFTAP